MIKTSIGGVTYTLRYDMGVMEYMADQYGSIQECMEAMSRDKTARKTLNDIFRVMCDAALEYYRDQLIILQVETPEELIKKSSPMWMLKDVAAAIREAIRDGMKTVSRNEDDNETRDLYLEEIEADERKKETPAG